MEEKLRKLSNERLADVVKNYRQHNYDDSIRTCAISILEERGVSVEYLQFTGSYTNYTFDTANRYYKLFKKNSLITLILYVALLVTSAAVHSDVLFILYIVLLASYFTFVVITSLNQFKLYKVLQQRYAENILYYIFLDIPFYIIMYFIHLNQMKRTMKEIQ